MNLRKKIQQDFEADSKDSRALKTMKCKKMVKGVGIAKNLAKTACEKHVTIAPLKKYKNTGNDQRGEHIANRPKTPRIMNIVKLAPTKSVPKIKKNQPTTSTVLKKTFSCPRCDKTYKTRRGAINHVSRCIKP
jgi:hypothetical protein